MAGVTGGAERGVPEVRGGWAFETRQVQRDVALGVKCDGSGAGGRPGNAAGEGVAQRCCAEPRSVRTHLCVNGRRRLGGRSRSPLAYSTQAPWSGRAACGQDPWGAPR